MARNLFTLHVWKDVLEERDDVLENVRLLSFSAERGGLGHVP